MTADPHTQTLLAASYGGSWPWGHPALLALHDVESPLAPRYARSLAEYFARSRSSGGPGTSAHSMAGPDALIRMVPNGNVSYNCGPRGNPITFALEQTGYASFTRPQWLTTYGLAQLERVAAWFAWGSEHWNIPLTWASDDEVREAYATGRRMGCVHHYGISNAIGGTDHWDTGSHFPDDLLLARARQIQNGDDMFEASDRALLKSIGERLAVVEDRSKLAHDYAKAAREGVRRLEGRPADPPPLVFRFSDTPASGDPGDSQPTDEWIVIGGDRYHLASQAEKVAFGLENVQAIDLPSSHPLHMLPVLAEAVAPTP